MTRVCVVGNGPLSDAQRQTIDDCDEIVRFNDMKNRRAGERTSLHVMREWELSHSYAGMDQAEPETRKLLVGAHANDDRRGFENASAIPLPSKHALDAFSTCPRKSEKVNRRPSTGTIALSHLESDPSVSRIDVFGMNFNFGAFQHHRKEASVVKDCCTKCVIHETPKSSYQP